MHDPELRDNPPAPPGGKRTRPFDYQLRVHNQSHPDIVGFIEEFRGLVDQYPGRFTLAEVGGDRALDEMHAFTAGDARLDSAYGFDFLYADALTPALVARAAQSWPDDPGTGWPAWAFENHDAPRAVSRWAGEHRHDLFARTKMLLLAALRGTIIIYQGEELGLPQVDVPFDRLRDPEAIANWPLTLSRDGARTPMPWSSDDAQMGFSSAEPWLPIGADHRDLAVDRQASDPASMLAFTRRCLALRQSSAALREGTMTIVEAGDQLLVFDREAEGGRLRCTFNLSDRPVACQRPATPSLIASGDIGPDTLGPWSATIDRLD